MTRFIAVEWDTLEDPGISWTALGLLGQIRKRAAHDETDGRVDRFSLAEIGARAGVSPKTVRRLLAELEAVHVVELPPDGSVVDLRFGWVNRTREQLERDRRRWRENKRGGSESHAGDSREARENPAGVSALNVNLEENLKSSPPAPQGGATRPRRNQVLTPDAVANLAELGGTA